MANTYTLINSTSLSTTTASVTFSAIPATYDDLILVCSARQNDAGSNATISVQYNSDTATNYSVTRLTGNGATASSGRSSSDTKIDLGESDGNGATSNTFSTHEVYIPSYRVSQNKPVGIFSAQENNTTTAYLDARAGLWRNTAAITSVKILPQGANSFVSGSTFWLYGIKNS